MRLAHESHWLVVTVAGAVYDGGGHMSQQLQHSVSVLVSDSISVRDSISAYQHISQKQRLSVSISIGICLVCTHSVSVSVSNSISVRDSISVYQHISQKQLLSVSISISICLVCTHSVSASWRGISAFALVLASAAARRLRSASQCLRVHVGEDACFSANCHSALALQEYA